MDKNQRPWGTTVNDTRQLLPSGVSRLRVALYLLLGTLSASVSAGPREQALQIHNRIAGVPPSETVLLQMADLIGDGNVEAAVEQAMENEHFYSVTLKNMATPWTNRDQSVFEPLNDYTATFIGMVRDGEDLRGLLYENVLYVGNASGLPAYANDDNQHYEALETQGLPLGDPEVLVKRTQSEVNGLPAEATAGVMTSRAAARAFFYAGTNRAMFRFTLLNHLCRDLEQVHDTSLTPDRIRQDVSRSPGGDSRVFLNNCMGCHNGMDPLAQAYAYYNWDYDPDADPEGEDGRLTYNREGETEAETGTRVVPKYHINANTFRYGYVTMDDQWDNYWRKGNNRVLGWSDALPGSGEGAKSMGMELAHSEAFASCQVEKVFRQVCLRQPGSPEDHQLIETATVNLASAEYDLRQAFIDTADYCKGE